MQNPYDVNANADRALIGGDSADKAAGFYNPRPQAGMRSATNLIAETKARIDALRQPAQPETPEEPIFGFNPETRTFFSGGKTWSSGNLSELDNYDKAGYFNLHNEQLPEGYAPVTASYVRAWKDKKAAERGFFSAAGETGRQLLQGIPDIANMGVQAAAMSAPAGSWLEGQLGEAASEYNATSRTPDVYGRGETAQAFIGAGRSLPASVAAGAASVVAPMAGTSGAGYVMGASQAWDTYQRGLAAGLSHEDAKLAALKTGTIEGVGETAADAIGARLTLGAGRVVGGVMRGTAIGQGKRVGVDLLANAALQSGTEYGQAYAQATVEKNAGISDQDPHAAGYEGFKQGLAMSAMMAPFGLASGLSNRQDTLPPPAPVQQPFAPSPAPAQPGSQLAVWGGDPITEIPQPSATAQYMLGNNQLALPAPVAPASHSDATMYVTPGGTAIPGAELDASMVPGQPMEQPVGSQANVYGGYDSELGVGSVGANPVLGNQAAVDPSIAQTDTQTADMFPAEKATASYTPEAVLELINPEGRKWKALSDLAKDLSAAITSGDTTTQQSILARLANSGKYKGRPLDNSTVEAAHELVKMVQSDTVNAQAETGRQLAKPGSRIGSYPPESPLVQQGLDELTDPGETLPSSPNEMDPNLVKEKGPKGPASTLALRGQTQEDLDTLNSREQWLAGPQENTGPAPVPANQLAMFDRKGEPTNPAMGVPLPQSVQPEASAPKRGPKSRKPADTKVDQRAEAPRAEAASEPSGVPPTRKAAPVQRTAPVAADVSSTETVNSDVTANVPDEPLSPQQQRMMDQIEKAYESDQIELTDIGPLQELVRAGRVPQARARLSELAISNVGAGRARFRQSAESGALRRTIESAVKLVEKALGGKIQVVILNSVTQFDSSRSAGSAAGAYKDGKVYVFIDGVSSLLDAQRTIFHELFHRGARKSPAYQQAMRKLYNQSAQVRAAANAWMKTQEGVSLKADKAVSPDEYLATAVDEALAETAEQKATPSTLRTLGNWLAAGADAIGLKALAQSIRTMRMSPLEKYIHETVQVGMVEGGSSGVMFSSNPTRGVFVTKNRLQDLLSRYAYTQNDREKDSKAYIGWVSPEDFLASTTPAYYKETLEGENRQLDESGLRNESQPIMLIISEAKKDVRTIAGHEGRHRMMALRDAGVKRVPVVLQTSWGVPREPLGTVTYESSELDGTVPPVTVTDITPINWESYDAILAEFGTQKGATDVRYRTAAQAITEASDPIKYAIKYDVIGAAKRAVLSSTFLRDLGARFTKDFARVDEHVKTVFRMGAKAGEIQKKAQDVSIAWQALSNQESAELSALMHEVTSRQLSMESEVKGLSQEEKAKQDELRAKFNALTDKQKTAYRMSRDELRAEWQQAAKLLAKKANDIYGVLIAKAQAAGNAAQAKSLTTEMNAYIADNNARVSTIRGDYFPLARFGQWSVVKNSPAFDALQKATEQAETDLQQLVDRLDQHTADQRKAIRRANKGLPADAKMGEYTQQEQAQIDAARKKATELRAQLEDAKSNPNEHSVSQFDTEGQARLYRDQNGGYVSNRQDRSAKEVGGVSRQMLDRLDQALEIQFGSSGQSSAAREAQRSLYQIYLSSLPEASALKRQMKRKTVDGANKDMHRNVVSTLFRNSFFLSRMEYGDQVTETLHSVRQEADEAARQRSSKASGMQAAAAELERRHDATMHYTETPVQDKITAISYLWFLGASPAFLITNLMQPGMVTVPMLSSRHGAATAGAMASAYKKTWKALRDSYKSVKEFSIEHSGLSEPHKNMLTYLMENRLLDVTMAHDLSTIADGGKVSKVTRLISNPSHYAELINRISSSIAAYDLEFAKTGDSAKAQQYAAKVVSDTHLDYSAENAPYWMKPGVVPLGKLLFQFKKYQLGMMSLLVKNSAALLRGATKEERREAAGLLVGVFATHGLVAGSVGLPLAGTVMAITQLVARSFGDEPEDVEAAYRNWLNQTFGKTAGTAIAKGVPAAFGVDMSQKAGLSNVMNPLSGVRDSGEKKGRDLYLEYLAGAAGPAIGGLGSRGFEFYDFMSNGEYNRAASSLLPKMFADVFKGARYADEGVMTRQGRTLAESGGLPLAVLMGSGFPLTSVADTYAANASRQGLKAALDDMKGDMLREWLRSDPAERAELQKTLPEVNKIRREYGLAPLTVGDFFRHQNKMRRPAIKNEQIVAIGAYADEE
jgi:hypothetical protein